MLNRAYEKLSIFWFGHDYEVCGVYSAVKIMTGTVRGEGFDLVIPSPKRVVSIKLEIDLIEEIDRLWRRLGYTSRSEFIREAIIYYMQIVTLRNREKELAVNTNEVIDLETGESRDDDSFKGNRPYIIVDTATDIA